MAKGAEMKFMSLLSVAALSVVAALAMQVRLDAQNQPATEEHNRVLPHYIVKDLGVLGTGSNSAGFGINNAGWVAGSSNSTSGGPQHAFVWYGGGPFIDAGTLGGAACPVCNSGGNGPNASGESAIGSDTAALDPLGQDFGGDGTHHQSLGAIWRNGRLTALPTLPGGHNANAFGLNNRSQIIGFSENGVHDPSCAMGTPFQVTRYEAVIWEPNDELRKLPPLTEKGDTVSFGFGINNSGQAVGSSGLCSNTGLPPTYVNGPHAVLWEADGSAIDILGDQGGIINVANSINNRGQVVGGSVLADGTGQTWVWSRQTGKHMLPLLPEAFFAVAPCCNTINDRGEIAGFSIDSIGSRAVVWLNQNIYDLNTLVSANSPLYLLSGYSINEVGEITGQGCVLPACTVLHAFVATPTNGEDFSFHPGGVRRPIAQPENVGKLLRLPYGIKR
jgi:probable HAF family extracellular repeat protein